jgi:hypothetical protein
MSLRAPPDPQPLLQAVGRRGFLLRLGLGAGTLAGLACGGPAPEDDPTAPWSFPGDESRPEWLAVAGAILAANPHNTQAWRFEIGPERIRLFFDPARSLGAMDPLGREQRIGLGCALENLVLVAGAWGRSTEVRTWPDPADPTLAAEVTLRPAAAVEDPLVDRITERHTNRYAYVDGALPAAWLEGARAQLRDARLSLVALSTAEARADFVRLTVDATRAIVADTEMNEASHAWYRHGAEALREHRDGIHLDTTGNDEATRFLGGLFGRPTAESAGEFWIAATEGRQATAGAFCAITSDALEDPDVLIAVGRAWQRLHLWTVAQGLAAQPLNQAAERRDRERQLGRASDFGDRLGALIGPGQSQLLFRVGVPTRDARPSARRPLAWVAA